MGGGESGLPWLWMGSCGRSEREPLLRHTDAKGREKHRQLRFCLEG